jgi:transglutaminase-like putative cysteine protease
VQIEPVPQWLREHTDYFGNRYLYFMMQSPHKSLSITVNTEVTVAPGGAQSDWLTDTGLTCAEAKAALAGVDAQDALLVNEYSLSSPMVPHDPEITAYAADLFSPDTLFLDAVNGLNARLFEAFDYDPGFSTVATPVAEVFTHRRGVCQDFAHLAIACLRGLGFPARYVSGYLETQPPPGQEKLIGADASHAWFSVWLPGAGWYDFDPTNNSIPAEQHITTAWGRDYGDVIPLCGVFFGSGQQQTLEVAVDVSRME